MSFHFSIRQLPKPFFTLLLAVFLMIAGLEFTALHTVHGSGPIIVNSLSDDQTSGGACSQVNVMCLRQAIALAGSTSGGATINFSVTGTITVGSTLVINSIPSSPITIDGTGNYPSISVAISGGHTSGTNGVQVMSIGLGTPSTVTLNNIVIDNGYSAGNGGAIESEGTLVVNGCAFTNNLAQGVGGAIDNGVVGSALIVDSTFVGNFVNNSGGAVSNENTMVISESTFNNNTTGSVGITYGGAVKNSGPLTVSNSTFFNNSSGDAGAIVNYGAQTTVSNSTISGNHTRGNGGGFDSTGGTLSLFSDIVAGNTADGIGPDVYMGSSVTSYGYNLIGDGSMSGIIATTGDQIGTSGTPINPNLGPLQNNGGSTYTMALLSPSVAIGNGSCAGAASVPTAFAISTDQRGDNRKNTGSGLGCDVGAYESNPLVNTVTPTATATVTATASTTSTPTPGTSTPPPGVQIIINGFTFSPNNLTIPVGTTVVWINQQQGVPHTTTSNTGVWGSAHLATGQWFAYTFNTLGDFGYHCAIHTSMNGVIHVVSPTSTATATTAPIPNIDTVGVYRSGTFLLRMHNNQGFADISVAFNPPGTNLPVVGDWTGAGFDAIGVFDRTTAKFTLCTANVTATCANIANQITFSLGNGNDTPLSGRWQLSATHAGAGVYRPSNGLLYLKNALSTGFADNAMVMGVPGDEGIAGDWTGKGFDSPGIFRPGYSSFYLSNQVTNGSVFADIQFTYGSASDLPIAGDWISQGHDGIGMFRSSNGFVYLRNSLTTGFADNTFFYGLSGDKTVAGHWQPTYPPIAPEPVLIARTAVPSGSGGSGIAPGDNQIGG